MGYFFDGTESEALSCKHCGYEYTHFSSVQIFDRGEDEKKGMNLTFEMRHGSEIMINQSMLNNPSPRRQGMSINVECEICGKITSTVFIQHKGQTFSKITKECNSNVTR
jgi:hypothetical protein